MERWKIEPVENGMNGKLEVCRDGPKNAGRIKKQDGGGADAVCAPLTMRRSASVSTAFFCMSGSLVERQRMSGATPPAAITAALPVNSCDADSSSSDANSCIAPSSATRRDDAHSPVVSEQSSIIIQSIIDCALLYSIIGKQKYKIFKCITGNLALRYAYKYDNNIVVSCCDQQHFYVLNFFSWGRISLPPAPKYTHGSTQCKSVQVSTSRCKSVQVDLRAFRGNHKR